jgi:6-phosphogluconolactonase
MLIKTPTTALVVKVLANPSALAATAAEMVVQAAGESIALRGRFTLVLSGGSTPQATYKLLADGDHSALVDWSRTYVFFGDERFVPPDDPRSNYGMARANLLSRIPIPAANVFPIPTEQPSALSAASAYAQTLAEFFRRSDPATPPQFDLIFLGMGSDGHTASLFPFAETLEVTCAWTAWSRPGTMPPPVDRITLTYPVLNAARQIVFLVEGRSKAAALRDILEGQAPREDRPAAGVQPTHGTVTWLIDKNAAQLLGRQYSN